MIGVGVSTVPAVHDAGGVPPFWNTTLYLERPLPGVLSTKSLQLKVSLASPGVAVTVPPLGAVLSRRILSLKGASAGVVFPHRSRYQTLTVLYSLPPGSFQLLDMFPVADDAVKAIQALQGHALLLMHT